MAGLLAGGVCSVALLPGIALAAAQPPAPTPEERAAALARPSVVYLESHWSAYVFDEDGVLFNDGQPYEFSSRCTGFVINPEGYIATAGHCVDPAIEFGAGETFISAAVAEAIEFGTYTTDDPGELFAFGAANWRIEGATAGSPADRQVFVQRGVATGGRTDGEALPARVVDFRPLAEGDVALLKVEKGGLSSIEVSESPSVAVGTPVLSIGYPGSTDEVTDSTLEPTNKDGKINAAKTVGTVSFLEMSAALSGGMSGGPTVGLDGKVLAVNSWQPSAEDEAFNYVAPATHLKELLSRNGVTNELAPTDVTYRQGLDAFWNGRYTDAIGAFDEVLALVPLHQQAQEYRQQAAQGRETFGDPAPAAAPATEDDGGGVPVALVVGAAVGAVGIAGAGALLLSKRGRAVPPAPPLAPAWGGPAPAAPPTVITLPDVIPSPTPPAATEVLSPMDAVPMTAAVGTGTTSAAPGAAPGSAPARRFCSSCGTPRNGGAYCSGCGAAAGQG